MNPYKRGTLLDPKKTWIWLVQRRNLRRLLVEQDGGRALVDGLLAALSGDLPAQFLEEGRGSLLGCLWKLRLFCPPEVFARWCGASLEVITANFASTEIAGDLLNAVSVDPPRRDAFHDAFVVFARCFQTNKRGRRRSRCFQTNKRGRRRSPLHSGADFDAE